MEKRKSKVHASKKKSLREISLGVHIFVKLSVMLTAEFLFVLFYLFFYVEKSLEHMDVYKVGALFLSLLVIHIFMAKIIAKEISEPFQAVERSLRSIKNKNWDEKIVQIDRQDEVGQIINALSKIQNQVAEINEEEAFFYQSVSHGLKTPIMVIRNYCMAMKEGVYGEEAMDIILKESLSLETGIKKLLYVTTFDHMMGKAKDFQLIDGVHLLKDLKVRFGSINEQVQIQIEADEAVYLWASEPALKTAIENILENSVRYAKSYIKMRLKESETAFELMIENDGRQIPKKTLDALFEKFYKGADGNFGLGLYITKKIIAFHEGEVWAVNFEQGVRFFVLLKKTAERN